MGVRICNEGGGMGMGTELKWCRVRKKKERGRRAICLAKTMVTNLDGYHMTHHLSSRFMRRSQSRVLLSRRPFSCSNKVQSVQQWLHASLCQIMRQCMVVLVFVPCDLRSEDLFFRSTVTFQGLAAAWNLWLCGLMTFRVWASPSCWKVMQGYGFWGVAS